MNRKKTASTSYSIDTSIGGVAGIATAAAPAQTAKTGYIAQLYEVTGLMLNAAPLTVNEGGTLQLAAWQLLDDATFLAVPATSVTWSVVSGPLAGINGGGLATAEIVYEDSLATAQGVFSGFTGSLILTVKNVNNDDYREYAGDLIDDNWQKFYFGLPPNPLAAPALDPDGDGQTNLFEFTAGLVPTDPQSRFTLTITPAPGQPSRRNVVFSPRFNDRTYVVKSKPDLSALSWDPLPSSSFSDNGQVRTVTDLNATGAMKFYHVEITKP